MITDMMPSVLRIPRWGRPDYRVDAPMRSFEEVHFVSGIYREGRGRLIQYYRCTLCRAMFFISPWDLNGLHHGCTNAVK